MGRTEKKAELHLVLRCRVEVRVNRINHDTQDACVKSNLT